MMTKYIFIYLSISLIIFSPIHAVVVWKTHEKLNKEERQLVKSYLLDYSWPSGRIFRDNPARMNDFPLLFKNEKNAEIDFLNEYFEKYVQENFSSGFNKKVKFISVPIVIWDLFALKKVSEFTDNYYNYEDIINDWKTDYVAENLIPEFASLVAPKENDVIGLGALIEDFLKNINENHSKYFYKAALTEEYKLIKEHKNSLIWSLFIEEFFAYQQNQAFFVRATRGIGEKKRMLDSVVELQFSSHDEFLDSLKYPESYSGLSQTKNLSFGFSLLGGYIRDGYSKGGSSWPACTMAYYRRKDGGINDNYIIYSLSIDKKQSYLYGDLFYMPKDLLTQGIIGTGEFFHPRIKNIVILPKIDLNKDIAISALNIGSNGHNIKQNSQFFKIQLKNLKTISAALDDAVAIKIVQGFFQGILSLSQLLANNSKIIAIDGIVVKEHMPMSEMRNQIIQNQKEAYQNINSIFNH